MSSYLSVHAKCIVQALHPVGLSYEMVSGTNLQRVLVSNLESLEYRKNPEQELSFRKAAKLVLSQGRLIMVEPNVLPAEGLHGLQPEDSPAPEELPLFNRTPFQQFFVPVPLGTATAGILHVWFQPVDANITQIRQALLVHACAEIELYFKSRRLGDIAQELTRLSTYARLLQELAGDIDLEAVTWNIVNYARETVACDRVCLFVATDYGTSSHAGGLSHLDYDYELFACSGIKKPHPRSEHAVILKGVAQKLTEMALARTPPVSPVAAVGSGTATTQGTPNSESDGASPPAPSKEHGTQLARQSDAPAPTQPKSPSPQPSDPPDGASAHRTGEPAKPAGAGKTPLPQIQLTLIQRDPAKTATRPREVNDYFEVLPMNWATVLPLFDRKNRVCGIVLFEGTRPAEQLEASFFHMRDLAVSAGRSLGTTLHWNKHQSLRLAQQWISFRDNLLGTSRRRMLINYVLPVVLVVGALAMPVTYHVKGEASIVSANQVTLPVLTSARLVSVAVREGQIVAKGELLATFDTTELQLLHRQAIQEYQRALVESDTAQASGNEVQMHISRLNAAKASALVEKYNNDILHSTIRAPFDGMVLGAQSLANRIGQYFRQGDTALEVMDPRHYQVKIALREQDIDFMENRLRVQKSIAASLKLAADPSKSYELALTDRSQLAYGLDISAGKYFFGAVLPLEVGEMDGTLFKSGFSGRASFDVAKRPLGYVLFRDFVNFIRLKFL